MNISLKVILAPFVGAFVGWLASKGFTLTPEQQDAAITLGAAGLTTIAHIFHEWSQDRVIFTPPQNNAATRAQVQSILESAKLPEPPVVKPPFPSQPAVPTKPIVK